MRGGIISIDLQTGSGVPKIAGRDATNGTNGTTNTRTVGLTNGSRTTFGTRTNRDSTTNRKWCPENCWQGCYKRYERNNKYKNSGAD